MENKTDYEKFTELIKSFGIETDCPDWKGEKCIRLDYSATAFEFYENGYFKSFSGGYE